MTLIVGRVVGDRVAIVSDTQLTEQGMPLSITAGQIKSYMLPGDLCVSFSNSPELAMREFLRFARTFPDGANFSEVIPFFKRASLETGNDFLLAFSAPSRLVKIADGKWVKSVAKTQWIGDKHAYERFREFEGEARTKAEAGRAINAVWFTDELEGSPASNLYSIMRQVIQDRSIPSVGGFACVIGDRGQGFKHSVYCDMLFDWPRGSDEAFKLQHTDQIDFGASGENRGFAVAQVTTGGLGLNVVAYYWLSAHKLFLFAGRERDIAMRCVVLEEVAPADIPKRLTAELGMDLHWQAMVLSASPTATASEFRKMPRAEGPNGVGFTLFCHLNTFAMPPVGTGIGTEQAGTV